MMVIFSRTSPIPALWCAGRAVCTLCGCGVSGCSGDSGCSIHPVGVVSAPLTHTLGDAALLPPVPACHRALRGHGTTAEGGCGLPSTWLWGTPISPGTAAVLALTPPAHPYPRHPWAAPAPGGSRRSAAAVPFPGHFCHTQQPPDIKIASWPDEAV